MRISVLAVLTLSIMFFLYPLLHELGHAAAAVCSGAEITEMSIFPEAHTSVLFRRSDPARTVITLLGGSLLPLVVLAVPDFRSFLLYYVKLTVALITAVSSIISAAGLSPGSGFTDDAAQALAIYPGMSVVIRGALALAAAISVSYCVLSDPTGRLTDFLSKSFPNNHAEREVQQKASGQKTVQHG